MAVCLAVLMAFAGGQFAVVGAQEITVAVMPFDGSVSSEFRQMDVTRQLTNLVTDKLVNAADFLIVERDKISEVLGEQDFGASGRVDPSHAVEIGRLLGAQVLVFGSVTQFEMTSGGGISIGGVSLSGTSGKAKMTGRIVDATSGVILGSVEGSGNATGASLSVRNLEGISFNASEFQNSALGRAVTRAVDDFVEGMSKVVKDNEDRVFAAQARSQVRGTVVALIDNGVVVNIGEKDGIRRGQQLEVFRLMEVEGLTDPVRVPVGVVQVISVDEGASVATFENMTSPAEVGDQVAPQ